MTDHPDISALIARLRAPGLNCLFPGELTLLLNEAADALAALSTSAAVQRERLAIVPKHEGADAFWKYWRENGETHRHGYYESTWGAINAALRVSGVVEHDYDAATSAAGEKEQHK